MTIRGIDRPPTDLRPLADQLKVLGEPKRLRILHMLMEGVQCNCELGDALDMAPNLISHHLRVLREAGLVDVERDPDDARWVYYSLNREALEELNRQVSRLSLSEDDVLFIPHLGGRVSPPQPALRGA